MQKHELTEYRRLRDEGRWLEANGLREAERKRLRAEGRTRQQARDESWKAMLAEFGAVELLQPAHGLKMTIEAKIERPLVFIDLENIPDFETVLRWTLSAIGKDPETLRLDQIPGPAYVSMLTFANEDPKTFWKWVAESDAEQTKLAESKKSFEADNQRLFAVMDAILADRQHTAGMARAAVGTL